MGSTENTDRPRELKHTGYVRKWKKECENSRFNQLQKQTKMLGQGIRKRLRVRRSREVFQAVRGRAQGSSSEVAGTSIIQMLPQPDTKNSSGSLKPHQAGVEKKYGGKRLWDQGRRGAEQD